MSRNNLGKILIADLEATCWEDETPPDGQARDIIEFGFVIVDVAAAEISPITSYLIKPERSEVSQYCTNLTTITPRMACKQGIEFSHLCNLLQQKWGTMNKSWGSYGLGDATMFNRQCHDFNIAYPFGGAHFDIARLFTLVYGSYNREPSLREAVEKLGLDWIGQAHRAGWDAYNTARVFLKLVNPKPQCLLSTDPPLPSSTYSALSLNSTMSSAPE